MDIFEVFEKLNIEYKIAEHKALFTIEESLSYDRGLEGQMCKNFFFKGAKGYYLVTCVAEKRANMKFLRHELHDQRIHFASEEDMMELIGIKPGSVTPLSIINDNENIVKVYLDGDLKDKIVLVHPNRNTATVAMKFDDLVRYIKYLNHECYIYEE